jgi:hypothetical protein
MILVKRKVKCLHGVLLIHVPRLLSVCCQVDETAQLQRQQVPTTNDEDKYIWDIWDQPSSGKVPGTSRHK